MICHNFDKRQNLHCKIRFFLLDLLQKRREEVSFIVFSMSVQMHLLRCGGGEGIPISNPNLHPCVASVRKDIPIFLFSSLLFKYKQKKLVVFLFHFRISLYFFVRLSLLSQVKSKKFHSAKSSNIVDSVL